MYRLDPCADEQPLCCPPRAQPSPQPTLDYVTQLTLGRVVVGVLCLLRLVLLIPPVLILIS
jgi:hypothetical protein